MAQTLVFDANGTFRILQFTDIHWENGDATDLATRQLMESILDDVRPNMVVFTGDVVAGYAAVSPLEAFQDAVAPVVARKIPWAVVFGNHDTERMASRDDMRATILQTAHTLNEPGPENVHGASNFATPIYRKDGSVGWVLYFFDSGANSPLPHVDGYDWIRRDQINWYVRTSEGYKASAGGHAMPALAFFHIPLPEYREAALQGVDEGNRLEDECAPQINTGLFAAMVEQGDVVGTFVGHDHLNDYVATLHGIRLCYGRATGYHGYGRDGFLRGARVICIREGESTFDTSVCVYPTTKES